MCGGGASKLPRFVFQLQTVTSLIITDTRPDEKEEGGATSMWELRKKAVKKGGGHHALLLSDSGRPILTLST